MNKRNIFFIISILILTMLLPAAVSADIPLQPGGIVLALSGGGTRGIAHVGILKVLEEENIPVVGIVGTSMGSIIGGISACGYNADQIASIIMDMDLTSLFYNRNTPSNSPLGKENSAELWSFYRVLMDENGKVVGPLGGLSGERLYEKLRDIVRPCRDITDFNDLPIPFAAVATDLINGEPVVIRDGDLAEAMRSSMSIPGLFEPWRLNGRLMVDGGLVANLPVRIAKKVFPGFPVVAVDIAASNKTEEEINSTVDVLDQCVNIMTSRELRQDLEAADLIIRPDVGQMPMLDTNNLDKVLHAGLESGRENADLLKRLSMNAPPCPVLNRTTVKELPRTRTLRTAEQNRSDDRRYITAKKYKYETLIGGSYSSFHDHNWLYADIVTRDLRESGDTFTANIVAGREWGLGFRYLNSGEEWKKRSETTVYMRKREFEPANAPDVEWYRFSASYTERFFLGPLRAGIGLSAEYYDADSRSDSYFIPTAFTMYNTLDDEIDPTSGTSIRADIWWPEADEVITRLDLKNVHTFSNGRRRLIIRGGLYAGDDSNPYFRAYLGGRQELYSVAENPLTAENMAWWRATIRTVIFKNWWGTINADLFYGMGYLMDTSFSIIEDPWETGLALSVPGTAFNGKLLVVYSEDDEWTFGITLGVPAWEDGPRQ